MSAGRIEARLRELGIVLPPPLVMPAATRSPAVLAGELLYLSGHGAGLLDDASLKLTGKIGRDVTQAEGYAVARAIGIKMIASIRSAIGDLDRVVRVVKLFGMVNAVPEFEHHNLVINGASDVFCEVFGEIGVHARSSLGVSGLVGNQTVEVEGVVRVRPEG
jgi:enamine deaminase RidA (YjgF/YER057c/UK114 family)